MVRNTWNDACADALATLRQLNRIVPVGETDTRSFSNVNNTLGEFVRNGSSHTEVAVGAMSHAAVIALRTLGALGYPVDYEELHSLLCRKQHDYGHKNIDNFGMIGVAVRICDKIARADNLLKREQNAVKDETIVDTYTDIIGYAVIALMLDKETFYLPLEDADYVR
jgi:hypothetical protein